MLSRGVLAGAMAMALAMTGCAGPAADADGGDPPDGPMAPRADQFGRHPS